jgi:hypothetical protein
MKERSDVAEPSPEINCSIFLSEEKVIKRLTKEINETKNVEQKAVKAQELIDEEDTLLSCKDYNAKNEDCKNCRIISDLRKKTAEIVVKAQKLAR